MMSLRDKLGEGSILLGMCLMYPCPGIIERIGKDWDWVWIDGQHGQHDYNSIMACVRACDLVNTFSVVRVPGRDYGVIGRILDTGANGIMVPMVNNARQAEEAVRAAKFPPLGERSYGGRRTIDMYGREYARTANDDSLLVLQVETREGLANIEEIVSVEGADAVFFGPDDLAFQNSMRMDQPREPGCFENEMRKIALSAKKAGKIAGTVTASPELIRMCRERGYLLCVGSGDVPILAEGSLMARSNLEAAAGD